MTAILLKVYSLLLLLIHSSALLAVPVLSKEDVQIQMQEQVQVQPKITTTANSNMEIVNSDSGTTNNFTTIRGRRSVRGTGIGTTLTTSNSNSNSTVVDSNDSSKITNNIQWVDTDTKILQTRKGGKITKLQDNDGDAFYWLGGTPGHILFYKSRTLGSDSWTLMGKMKHSYENQILGNCQIHYHPKYKRHSIFCKSRQWFVQHLRHEEEGEWEEVEEVEEVEEGEDELRGRNGTSTIEPTDGNYKELPKPAFPSYPPWDKNYKFGGQSTYQEGDHLYLIVSCAFKNSPARRILIIYKLNDKWDGFESEVVRFSNRGKESPWLIKRNDTYYLFQSQTRFWRQSITYYQQAPSMKDFANADFERIRIHPQDNRLIKSLGSQFRMIIQPQDGDDDKWIFGGDRYPEEDPDNWARKFGRFVMSPMRFIDDIPHVYWKEVFDWETYDYYGKDYDSYPSEGYGPNYSTIINDKFHLPMEAQEKP